MRLLKRFLKQVGSKMDPDVLMIDSKRFTLNQELERQQFSRKSLVYAGTYMGRNRRLFEPGSPLLQMLAAEENTRKAHLDRDAGRTCSAGIAIGLAIASAHRVIVHSACLWPLNTFTSAVAVSL